MIKLMSLLVKSVAFINIAAKSTDFVDALTTKSYVPRQVVSPRPTTTTTASSQQNKKQHKLLQQEKQQKIDVVDAGISGSPQTSQYEESNLLKKAQAVLQAKVESEELETMNMWELAQRDPILLAKKITRDMLIPHEDFVLFKTSDIPHWIAFSVIFVGVLIFDNLYLFRKHQVLELWQASLYALGYVGVALAFVFYVYLFKGADNAATWFSGYLLEWMLSVDNLFVFRMVFDIYATPDKLKHKPLFYGIIGAIFFRMVFFVVGEALIHTLHFMHIVFGAFLVYTGIHVALFEDEDGDPTEHPIIVWASEVLPLINGYDESGRFFVKCEVLPDGTLKLPPESTTVSLPDLDKSSSSKSNLGADSASSASHASKAHNLKVYESQWGRSPRSLPQGYRVEWRCTFLFIVVVCLEITDLMFAVDSVSAIVAQVPDLYLAYTACIMAMLGLRATFLIVDELMRLFEYLKYGVAFILVFIGFKLILSKVVIIPSFVVTGIFTITLAICAAISMAGRQARSQAPSPATPRHAGTASEKATTPRTSGGVVQPGSQVNQALVAGK